MLNRFSPFIHKVFQVFMLIGFLVYKKEDEFRLLVL